VPACQHLAAQKRSAPKRGVDLAQRERVRRVHLRSELSRSRELLDRGPFDSTRPAGKAGDSTPQRASDQGGARLRVHGESVQPAAHGGERAGGNEISCERALWHDEQVDLGEPPLAEHRL
jgi:hypothetical protein